ncbi:class II aldolase/adducin family protein [Amycolatopsis rhabdoformis]|uniref:Class II aldolase/adducin family protein n=1 Tax=Amycolatopsis rhabdoformis TaxID=1448059 RepID=A0ABZ1ICQ9_9PSEU|nr:class II aldolase/adducin family protein [Amycolatopsis rhabdoformis]WSE32210.1 class II aldolase/adducin family protein [Amycolatopsis rhabdoformis]
MSDSPAVEELRALVALSCRILAWTGCVREITGHVSVRVPGTDQVLVRCRPQPDPGVRFTIVDDIHLVGLESAGDELPHGYALPGEWAIHTELYRSRPDVGAVVHGHPEASLKCGILGLPLEPVIGAYDPGAMELAVRGVPTYPRAVLISDRALGGELAAAMGGSDACLLSGHGVVAVGEDVQQATVRAIKLETLAGLTLDLHSIPGATPKLLSADDIAAVSGFVDSRKAARTYAHWTWDFYRHSLGAVADVTRRD